LNHIKILLYLIYKLLQNLIADLTCALENAASCFPFGRLLASLPP